jgi:hypothetical protein
VFDAVLGLSREDADGVLLKELVGQTQQRLERLVPTVVGSHLDDPKRVTVSPK